MVDRFAVDFASRIAGCFPGARDFALDCKYQTDDESELGLQTLWLWPRSVKWTSSTVIDLKAMQQQFERVYRLTLSTEKNGMAQVALHGRFAEEEVMVILSTRSATPLAWDGHNDSYVCKNVEGT